MLSYYDQEDSEEVFILSPWSEVLTYGKGGASLEKPTRLEKPTISNPVVGKNPDGSPKISFTSITPKQVQDASNYIQARDMKNIEAQNQININNTGWIKADAGAWWLGSEFRSFDVPITYDNGKEVIIDKSYIQIKTRYVYDGGSNVGALQSEWSNIISINAPVWKNASTWATEELQKASELGLIPDTLKGADMTKPITREEFCEIAVKLYEALSGKTAAPINPNPFTDTSNSEILKAYNLGIVKGTAADKFSPNKNITRQEICVMLLRALKAVEPGADYSATGVAAFPDESLIASWAIDAVRYMSKAGVIKGVGAGKIDPLGNTTREHAILLVYRTYADNI